MNEQISETTENKIIYTRYLVHALLTLGIVSGIAWFSNKVILSQEFGTHYFLFVGVLCAVILLCSLLERKKIYATWKSVGILTVCFLLSGLLLLLSDYYVNLPVWVLGGIIVAALVDRNIGMLYLYFFVYHAIYLQGNVINGLVFHFVVATMICLVIPKMKNFLSMFYMMAFTGCVIVTCSIINNHFGLSGEVVLDIFYILCTYLTCILITMLLVKWLGEKEVRALTEPEAVTPDNDYSYLEQLAQDTARKDEIIAEVKAEAVAQIAATAEQATEETETELTAEPVAEAEELTEEVVTESAEEPAETIESQTEETESEPEEAEVYPEETNPQPEEAEVSEEVVDEPVDYTAYCNEKSELLMELRSKNKAVYAQSVLVGKLAAETAAAMGLNVELTKAAGLYKRIGKIMDDMTADTTTEIASVYEFPQELVELLDQLNHDIIARKEAAVLLLTDGVISYYSVMRHGQKNDISVEKIVDTIVSKKIFTGEMNESGLTMTECAALRERLVTLLREQDRRRNAKNAERKV